MIKGMKQKNHLIACIWTHRIMCERRVESLYLRLEQLMRIMLASDRKWSSPVPMFQLQERLVFFHSIRSSDSGKHTRERKRRKKATWEAQVGRTKKTPIVKKRECERDERASGSGKYLIKKEKKKQWKKFTRPREMLVDTLYNNSNNSMTSWWTRMMILIIIFTWSIKVAESDYRIIYTSTFNKWKVIDIFWHDFSTSTFSMEDASSTRTQMWESSWPVRKTATWEK